MPGACHEQIHLTFESSGTAYNHHNFAWNRRLHLGAPPPKGLPHRGWATGTYPRKHGNTVIVMFRFALAAMSRQKAKGEFHPVAMKKFPLEAGNHTDWGQHQRDAISLQETHPG